MLVNHFNVSCVFTFIHIKDFQTDLTGLASFTIIIFEN